MSVIIKIKAMYSELTNIEKKVADYILSDPDSAKLENTYEMATKTNSSQASIVRFVKKLGYKGYPEFRIALSQDLGNRKANSHIKIMHEEINENDSFEVIGKKIIAENNLVINHTYEITDFAELENAKLAIFNANKIMVAGIGFSGVIAKDFYYKLLELGYKVFYENDNHMQLSCLSTMRENDVLFIISHSGKTKEMYNLVKLATNRNIKVIAMTSIAPNPIRDLANIRLNTVEMQNNFRATALTPRISQLTVIDMLYAKMVLDSKVSRDYIFKAITLVDELKIK